MDRPRRLGAAASGIALVAALLAGLPSGSAFAQPTQAAHRFQVDRSSAVPAQDQLASALARAARTRDAVVLPPGRLVLTRTLWMPEHATLRLDRGASITGAVAGQSLLRMAAGSTVEGGAITNTAASDCFDVDFAPGARGAVVQGVRLAGPHANAVYLGTPGLDRVTVARNRFDGVVYGVLVNTGAVRASGLRITGNSFVRIGADAIEINSAMARTSDFVHGVTISGNRVTRMLGSGNGAGFGVGIAGVRGFAVTGNTISGARNEAIHIEDRSSSGVVRDNVIRHGGVGYRPAVAVYPSVSSVTVRRNTVDRFTGDGIAVLWDARGSSRRITIEDNLVTRVTGSSIVVSGDRGTGPFTVRGNRLVTAGGFGIVVLGTHARSVVRGNEVRRAKHGVLETAYRGSGTRVYTRNGALHLHHPTGAGRSRTR